MRFDDESRAAEAPDAVRSERTALLSGGVLSLLLAVVGSVTSLSVVGSGSDDGARYLTVNIGLGVLGLVLLLTAWRRRRRELDSVTDARI